MAVAGSGRLPAGSDPISRDNKDPFMIGSRRIRKDRAIRSTRRRQSTPSGPTISCPLGIDWHILCCISGAHTWRVLIWIFCPKLAHCSLIPPFYGALPHTQTTTEADSLDAEIRERALRDGAGGGILRKEDGRRVQVAWKPGIFEGIEWVVVSEVDLQEVQADTGDERRAVLVVALLVWLAWGVLTLGRARPTALARHRI